MGSNVIFLDECGYTGSDLLNQEQPVFVLASLNFSEPEAVDLKKKFFGRVQARELKHSALSRRPAQQSMVLSFLRELAPQESSYGIYAAHKKHVLVAKLIDLVVEPFMRSNGFDIYDGGVNLSMANVYSMVLPVFMGQEPYGKLLASFQKFVIEKTQVSFDQLLEVIEEGFKGREEARELLFTLKLAFLNLEAVTL